MLKYIISISITVYLDIFKLVHRIGPSPTGILGYSPVHAGSKIWSTNPSNCLEPERMRNNRVVDKGWDHVGSTVLPTVLLITSS